MDTVLMNTSDAVTRIVETVKERLPGLGAERFALPRVVPPELIMATAITHAQEELRAFYACSSVEIHPISGTVIIKR